MLFVFSDDSNVNFYQFREFIFLYKENLSIFMRNRKISEEKIQLLFFALCDVQFFIINTLFSSAVHFSYAVTHKSVSRQTIQTEFTTETPAE